MIKTEACWHRSALHPLTSSREGITVRFSRGPSHTATFYYVLILHAIFSLPTVARNRVTSRFNYNWTLCSKLCSHASLEGLTTGSISSCNWMYYMLAVCPSPGKYFLLEIRARNPSEAVWFMADIFHGRAIGCCFPPKQIRARVTCCDVIKPDGWTVKAIKLFAILLFRSFAFMP